MMMELGSYPKVWNVGHPQVREILQQPVVIEEKVDGSQFSAGLFNGDLCFRSKGTVVHAGSGGMFEKAVQTFTALKDQLHPNWVYRGEYLQKPKHNALTYARVPKGHVVLFDVGTGLETYLSPEEKAAEADRLGLEVVPSFGMVQIASADQLLAYLERESFLGGPKIEGIVLKSYSRFTEDGHVMLAKFVSEAFKEVHKGEWKIANPNRADILEAVITSLVNENRWRKAVQALREAGTLQNAVQDIGPLIQQVQKDVEEECGDVIREALWNWGWPQIKRRCAGGLPQWYKEHLLSQAFSSESPVDTSSPESSS